MQESPVYVTTFLSREPPASFDTLNPNLVALFHSNVLVVQLDVGYVESREGIPPHKGSTLQLLTPAESKEVAVLLTLRIQSIQDTQGGISVLPTDPAI